MADKRIDELEEALTITANDLFVLEQANTAKKLSGQTMTAMLTALANGHGGIASIAKTGTAGTDPVVDTYTITYADGTSSTFTVTNGLKGDTGAQGPTGPSGANITILSTSIAYQEWTSGTQYPTGTWVNNPPAVAQGNYLWTRVIVNYSDGSNTVAYSVSRMGIDGSGAVSTVCGVSPDGTGNVAITASDVGALADTYQPPVTSVNGKTGAVTVPPGIGSKLWENSTPAAVYQPDTVPLDLTGYRFVLIVFITYVAQGPVIEGYASEICLKGVDTFLHYGRVQFVKRKVTVSDSGVTFGTGLTVSTYGGTETTANSGCVPFQIYGIE